MLRRYNNGRTVISICFLFLKFGFDGFLFLIDLLINNIDFMLIVLKMLILKFNFEGIWKIILKILC